MELFGCVKFLVEPMCSSCVADYLYFRENEGFILMGDLCNSPDLNVLNQLSRMPFVRLFFHLLLTM